MKFLTLLCFAFSTVSAISKKELETTVTDTIMAFEIAADMYISNYEDATSETASQFPQSADCLWNITYGPLAHAREAIEKVRIEVYEKAEVLDGAIQDVSPEDKTTLAVLRGRVMAFAKEFDPKPILAAKTAPMIEQVRRDSKRVCHCDKYGWCQRPIQ